MSKRESVRCNRNRRQERNVPGWSRSDQPGFEIFFKADQRQAKGDRLEVFPVGKPSPAEPLLEYVPHRRNERATAGEEYVVDVAVRDALAVEQPVDGLCDASDVFGDPRLKIRANDLPLNVEVAEVEPKCRGRGRRQAHLRV